MSRAFAIFLLFMACRAEGQARDPCRVIGTITGLGNRVITVHYRQQGIQRIDSVRVVEDRFTYRAQPSDDDVLLLQVQEPGFTQLWYEPGTVYVTGSLANSGELRVRGTPENEVLARYYQLIDWPLRQRLAAHPDSMNALDKLLNQHTRFFIQTHPTAWTSAFLLYYQLANGEVPVAEYTRLLQLLSPAVQASRQGQVVVKQLQYLQQQPVPGKLAPAFTLPDTAGVATALHQFRGRFVLLDFWAHWCGPCLRAMPALQQLQTRYRQQLSLIGIAREYRDERLPWQQAIRQQQATWTQLSDLAGDSGIIAQYNITAYPTYLLLDKQGSIVARSHDLTHIEEKLTQLVSGSARSKP